MAISVPHIHTHTHESIQRTHTHTCTLMGRSTVSFVNEFPFRFALALRFHSNSTCCTRDVPLPLCLALSWNCSLSLGLSLCALVPAPWFVLSLSCSFVWPVSSRCLGYAADEARSLRFVSVWLHKSSNPIDTLRPTAREYKIIKIHFSFVFCFRVFRCIKQPTLEIDLNKFK